MKHQSFFEETVKSLGIQVYTEGFTAEQIFYQIENKTKDKFAKLEKMIKKNSSKPNSETSNKDDKYSSTEDDISNTEEYSEEIHESDMEEYSEDESTDYNEDDESSNDDEDSVNFSSEESVKIEAELWDEDFSDTEILNLPACEVMKILKKK